MRRTHRLPRPGASSIRSPSASPAEAPPQWLWLRLYSLRSPPTYIVACAGDAFVDELLEFVVRVLGRPPPTLQLVHATLPLCRGFPLARQLRSQCAQVLVQARGAPGDPYVAVPELPAQPIDVSNLHVIEDGVFALRAASGRVQVAGYVDATTAPLLEADSPATLPPIELFSPPAAPAPSAAASPADKPSPWRSPRPASPATPTREEHAAEPPPPPCGPEPGPAVTPPPTPPTQDPGATEPHPMLRALVHDLVCSAWPHAISAAGSSADPLPRPATDPHACRRRWLRLRGYRSPPFFLAACDSSLLGGVLHMFAALLLSSPPGDLRLLHAGCTLRCDVPLSQQRLPEYAAVLVQVRASDLGPFISVAAISAREVDTGVLRVTPEGVYALADREGWTLIAGCFVTPPPAAPAPAFRLGSRRNPAASPTPSFADDDLFDPFDPAPRHTQEPPRHPDAKRLPAPQSLRQGWPMANLPLDDMQNAWGSIAADYIREAAELEDDEATDD
ncbi:MAG: hypothetical protein GY772_19390 [bacterium]|nr:hypothetical protein [bacterium]